MHKLQQSLPFSPQLEGSQARADRRRRYEAVLAMIREWRMDESGYEEQVWPELVRQIEANRLSPRRRFSD